MSTCITWFPDQNSFNTVAHKGHYALFHNILWINKYAIQIMHNAFQTLRKAFWIHYKFLNLRNTLWNLHNKFSPRPHVLAKKKETVTQLLLFPSMPCFVPHFQSLQVWLKFCPKCGKDLANNKEIKLRHRTGGKKTLSFKEFKETKEKQQATFFRQKPCRRKGTATAQPDYNLQTLKDKFPNRDEHLLSAALNKTNDINLWNHWKVIIFTCTRTIFTWYIYIIRLLYWYHGRCSLRTTTWILPLDVLHVFLLLKIIKIVLLETHWKRFQEINVLEWKSGEGKFGQTGQMHSLRP